MPTEYRVLQRVPRSCELACPWREIKTRPIDEHEIDYTDYVKREGKFTLEQCCVLLWAEVVAESILR